MFPLCLSLNYRYTLDPFAEEGLGTSGCTKMHLVGAALDPRAKVMSGVQRNVKRQAFGCVEALGAQIIDEKLAEEFAGKDGGPSISGGSSAGSDSNDGPGGDDTTAGAKEGKGILFQVLNQSLDDEVSTWNNFLSSFSLRLRSSLLSLPRTSKTWPKDCVMHIIFISLSLLSQDSNMEWDQFDQGPCQPHEQTGRRSTKLL